VTSYGVGMAVPDWPTTFGMNMFLYDFWNAPFGVKVEHAHRLYGAAVGMATIVLAAWFLAFERRRFMKILGVLALAAVIVQGVMGGLRVSQISTTLAAIHGCFGQAFFGLMVALCVLTGRGWQAAGPARPDNAGLRSRAAVMLGLVYLQVVIGAWFRHFGTAPALWTHIAVATAVWAHAGALSLRVARRRGKVPTLWPSARALAVVVTLQVALGVAALWLMLPLGGNPRTPTLWQAMLRTAHQTNGALLLAASVVLTLRTFRQLGPETATSPVSPPTSHAESAARTMEAVA
jgi:heme a synthase